MHVKQNPFVQFVGTPPVFQTYAIIFIKTPVPALISTLIF